MAEVGGSVGMYRAAIGVNAQSLDAAFARLRNLAPNDGEHQRLGKYVWERTSNPYGKGHWDTYVFDDVAVIVSQCHYDGERSETCRSEGFVEFHLSLSGSAELHDKDRTDLTVDPASMIVCERGCEADYEVRCERGARVSVSIYVRPDVLIEKYGMAEGRKDPLGPEEISIVSLPMSASLADLASKLVGANIVGPRRLRFANGLVEAILSLAVSLWDDNHVANEPEILTARDVHLFARARQIMIDSDDKPITIAALAREVGTNETKLKSGFKLMYGVTIFEFGHTRRMRRAMKLLTQERHTVGTVARMLGYSSQASFGWSFKKHFGITPSSARKLRRAGHVSSLQDL